MAKRKLRVATLTVRDIDPADYDNKVGGIQVSADLGDDSGKSEPLLIAELTMAQRAVLEAAIHLQEAGLQQGAKLIGKVEDFIEIKGDLGSGNQEAEHGESDSDNN